MGTQPRAAAAFVFATTVFATLWGVLVAPQAFASVTLGPHDVRSMFHISRSNNRNEVHYGLRLTEVCEPVRPAPVFAYWREHEVARNHVSALLDQEQAPYGVSSEQQVVKRGGRFRIHFRLNAFADRPLTATVASSHGRCTAYVTAQVQDRAAVLERVHVVLGFLWSIERIVIEGRALDGTTRLREEVSR